MVYCVNKYTTLDNYQVKINQGAFSLSFRLLSQKRNELYNAKLDQKNDRNRGEETNVKRKANQYFFDFNGSFWADELGDYSFGLKSQCTDNTKIEK